MEWGHSIDLPPLMSTQIQLGLVAVNQGLQEGDYIVLFLIGQAELANRHVFVVAIFRHRPAGHLFHGALWAMTRKNAVGIYIASVVEVDHLFQAQEIAVVHVGFHEARVRHLCCIARSYGLEFTFKLRQQYSPIQVWKSTIVAVEE